MSNKIKEENEEMREALKMIHIPTGNEYYYYSNFIGIDGYKVTKDFKGERKNYTPNEILYFPKHEMKLLNEGKDN